MPNVSVICIAKDEADLIEKERQLSTQTYRDFEFVGVAGGTIPEAWNRAILRSTGNILVFTETDATPIYPSWLEELVGAIPDETTVVKGLEVTGLPWDLSNLACYRTVLVDENFDESFRWAEDTDLFCRLKQRGYELRNEPVAPVLHLHKLKSKRLIRRAFMYGIYEAKLRYRYRDPAMVAGFELVSKQLLASLLNLLGLVLGHVIFLPELLRNDKKK